MTNQTSMELLVDEIVVCDRLRALNRDAVEQLKLSIANIGLQTPISVRFCKDGWKLIAGHHRLEACIELGWTKIAVREVQDDEVGARLWEISENLHRAELTLFERSAHIVEWIRLTDQSAQVAPIESKREDGRGHRRKGGINRAVCELGLERTEAQRAVKIDSLAAEVKQQAQHLGLAENQYALLHAARQSSKEEQLRWLREYAFERSGMRLIRRHTGEARRRMEALVYSFLALSHEERLLASERIFPEPVKGNSL
jgi:ParB-like chromosome segregation protein Spo0J